MGDGLFFQAFVYLTAAVVSVPIAKRLGLGSVLGYLIAGVVIGPFALGLIGSEGQDVMHFAEFGVVMMLFLIGLELEPSRLLKMRDKVLGLGGLQVVATAIALAGVAIGVGQPWRVAVAIGLILALSSTAMVLQTLAEKGLMQTHAGQSSFAVLLFQDIAVIPMLALLPLLAPPGGSAEAGHGGGHGDGHGGGHGGDGHGGDGHGGPGAVEAWVDALPPWGEALVVLAAVALIVLAGRFLTRPLFRFIAATRLRELFTATALVLVIGIALLMTAVGVSPALGTFLAGVVLAGSEYRHELEAEIEPFKGLLLGVFFIAVGASIDFGLIGANPEAVAAIVVALVAIKLAILGLLARIFGMRFDQGLLFAFALAQGGEFAFVLISVASQSGILGPAISAPLIAAVAVSMATTPLLLLLAERFLLPRFGTRESEADDERDADVIEERNPVIMAGFGSFGSTVGRFMRAHGKCPTVLDNDSDRVELLRKMGLEVYYGDATRTDLLHAAGAEDAKLIILALDDPEKNLSVVKTVRKHFPHLEIMARALDWDDAYDLINAGVDHVYRQNVDTALRAGGDALRKLGLRAYSTTRAAQIFRCHDEDALRELATMRDDENRYIDRVRERIRLLEERLAPEEEVDLEARDAGWDIDSLREEYGGRADGGNQEDGSQEDGDRDSA